MQDTQQKSRECRFVDNPGMGIGKYIREIGRGRDGARALQRAQAADLLGQILDGAVSDLEVGAFCIAMRIKGETAEEMAGFLDATAQRLQYLPATTQATIVIPSYNGARKLPVLTPLLGLLLARQGLAVMIHGTCTEVSRVPSSRILEALDIRPQTTLSPILPGELAFVPTALLCPSLQRLLEVRHVLNLRNSAHSVVKLLNPCLGKSLLLSSYTHPEYATSMAATLALMGSNALLLRGTEGEAVADPRRMPKMQAFVKGHAIDLQTQHEGTLTQLPELPQGTDAANTASYIRRVLAGEQPVPASIAQQVAHVLRLAQYL